MQLRVLLCVVAATGCVSELGSEIEVLPDDDTVAVDPQSLGEATKPAGPARLAADDAPALTSSIDAAGRAYGISISVLGADVTPPTPDTDVENPGSLLELPAGAIADAVFSVSNDADATLSNAYSYSRASANDLAVTIPGLVIRASHVAAKASAMADRTTSGISTAGSVIQHLVINGVPYGTISTAQTIIVPGIAEVALLGRTTLADGVAVDAIRIRVYDQLLTPIDESSEIIVSHAEAFAVYPQSDG